MVCSFPDVMMPVYKQNRWWAAFYIVYISLELFLFMNLVSISYINLLYFCYYTRHLYSLVFFMLLVLIISIFVGFICTLCQTNTVNTNTVFVCESNM